jgi:hypothetical protein
MASIHLRSPADTQFRNGIYAHRAGPSHVVPALIPMTVETAQSS